MKYPNHMYAEPPKGIRNFAIVSGHFQILHGGHIDYINGAAEYGDVVVIVNNDEQSKNKGSFVMDIEERLKIIRSLRNVYRVVESFDTDGSVLETLKLIHSLLNKFCSNQIYFCNGGDRTPDNTNSAEEEYCKQNGIELVYNVGGGKTNSSSSIRKLLQTRTCCEGE